MEVLNTQTCNLDTELSSKESGEKKEDLVASMFTW